MKKRAISVFKEIFKIYKLKERMGFILNCVQSVFSELAFGVISWYIFDTLYQDRRNINCVAIYLISIAIYFIFLVPLWGYLMEVGQSLIKKHFSNLLVNRYFLANPLNVNKLHSSYLLELLQIDTAKISEYGGWDTVVLIQAIISGFIAMFSFAMISWEILALLILLGCIPIFLNTKYAKKNRNIFEKVRKLYEEKAEMTINVIDNYIVLKLYDAIAQSIEQIMNKHNEMMDVQEQVYFNNERVDFVHDLIYQGLYKIVILIGGMYLYRKGEVTIGAIAFMLSMSEGLAFFLNDVGMYYRNVQELNISKDKIQNCINNSLDVVEFSNHNNDKLKSITLQNVSFKYSDNEMIFERVNYQFVSSHNYLILGKNGVGKSTLLKLIFRLYLPCNGKIFYNENELQTLCDTRISFVPQEPRIFSGTLKENLLDEGMKSGIQEIKKVLQIVRLDNLDIEGCEIEENGNNFSKGQLARIVLARALLQKPDFLLLDEVDANIDEIMLNNILHDIKKWNKECCIIAISHNESYASYRGFVKVIIGESNIMGS